MSYKKYIKNQQGEVSRYLNEIKDANLDKAYNVRMREAFDFFKPCISLDHDILDIGCRDGRLLDVLKVHGYKKICGVDIVPEAVEIAKQKGHECFESDAHDLTIFDSNSFDFVIASHVLEHCTDIPKVISEICRILTPQAHMFVEVPLGRSDKPFEWGHHINFKNKNALLNIFPDEFTPTKILTSPKNTWVRVIFKVLKCS